MNRRRDAFVLVLIWLGLTRKQICALKPTDVSGTGLSILGRHVGKADDPAACAACAVHDWLRCLSMVAAGGRGEAQSYLTTGDRRPGHRCAEQLDERWRRVMHLVPSIDRHGWADQYEAISPRTVSSILHTWTGQAPEGLPAELPPADRPGRPTLTWSSDVDSLLDTLEAKVDAISERVDDIMRAVGEA